MIYVFKDGSGYQQFPEPGPSSKPYLSVSGPAEDRILAGEPYRLIDFGNAVEFLTPQEIGAEALAKAKAEKRDQINNWRSGAERAGFTFNFPDNTSGTVQTRERDITNITGLVMAAQANPGGVFQFRDGEDVTHPMTAADLIALGNAVQSFITGNYAHAWSLKDQVESATTVAAVEAITWE
jgi:hypothetical protein